MSPATLVLLTLLTASAPPGAEAVLRTQCRTWAADPKNPWALAHGITAEGRRFKASDRRLAVDVIISDYLGREGQGAQVDLGFDNFTRTGQPVEPHPAMQVKTLLQAGLPLTHRFRASWGPVTLGALVEDLKQDFPLDIVPTPDAPWVLEALTRVLSPGASFRNRYGDTVQFDSVMEEALATLEREQAPLLAAMKARQPQLTLGRAPVEAHPCEGLHYFQAVGSWARHPAVRRRWGARLEEQLAVLFYRLESESRQYESAPDSLPMRARRLKFYGHWLETVGRYRQDTGWKPTAEQHKAIQRARELLDKVARQLEAAGDFRSLEALKTKQYSLHLDLIGDSCHAVNGLGLWKR